MEEEVILGTYLNNNLVFTTLKSPTKLQLLEGSTQTTTVSQEGHSQQIILLSSIVYNYNKKVLVTTSLDKTLIMWQVLKKNTYYFEQLQKLLGFFAPVSQMRQLKESGVLITGDQKGELILWDFLKSKILYAFRGQHNSTIIAIELMGPNKFMVASIDNTISIWKTKPKANSDLIDLCVCEKIVSDNFGGLTNLHYIQQDVVMATNQEGGFRLYDLGQKSSIDYQQIHSDRVLELVYENNMIITLGADNAIVLLQVKNNQIQVIQKISEVGIIANHSSIQEPRSRLISYDGGLTLLADQAKELHFYSIL